MKKQNKKSIKESKVKPIKETERLKEPQPIEINLKNVADLMTLVKPMIESTLGIPNKILPNRNSMSRNVLRGSTCEHTWHFVRYNVVMGEPTATHYLNKVVVAEFICDKCGQIKKVQVKS